jgi:hypothetical protein
MPKLSALEMLLALFAGRERAAAMMGDLTEMAATRGQRWFFAAYARTLASVAWRIVLALFVAEVGRELVFNLANLYFQVTPPTWRTSSGPYLLTHMGPFFACIQSTLWFALPFAAVRYGVRDRFVQLTLAVALGTTVAFLFIPWASLLCAAATVALAAVALFSTTWRKPMEVLAWTGVVGVLAIGAENAARLTFHPQGSIGHLLAIEWRMFAFQATLLIVAIVCSRLHGWLLDGPDTSGAAAG